MALGLLSASCAAPGATPAATPPTGAPPGRSVYEARCASCHDPGASKAKPVAGRADLEPARIEITLRRSEGKHPTFGPNVVSDDQLAALISYLGTATPAPQAK